MSVPAPGQVWLIRPRGALRPVAAIRSCEQDSWTVLRADDRVLVVLPQAVPVRLLQDQPVPVHTTWDERVQLLARFARPYAGAST